MHYVQCCLCLRIVHSGLLDWFSQTFIVMDISGNIAYLTLSNSQPTYIQCVVFFVHYGEEQVETEYMKRNLK